MSKWAVVYEKAIRDDGSLFFPERLNHEFLESAKRSMGSYLFANQYQNEIIPAEDQVFRRDWLKYYAQLPTKKHTYAFIDPAISAEDTADYTALVVIDVDVNKNWFVRNAQRFRINPTQIVNLCFKVAEQFKPQAIGIEDVAYQKALLYIMAEEMKKRKQIIPVTGIHPGTDKTKQTRILGLVPRFEWGTIFLSQGLVDLEMELFQFPRGAHDDLIDALSQLDQLVVYPTIKEKKNERPPPNHPDYERWYIQNLHRTRAANAEDD